MKKFKEKTYKFIVRFSRFNVLSVILVVVVFFNILSVKVFPQSLFLASAANIEVGELVRLINLERKSRGLTPVTVDSRLVEAAQAKGLHMIEKDYWSHYSPDGISPWKFIVDADYDYSFAGENLGKDFTTAAPLHNAWMNSPSHKENIVSPSFMNVGVAVVSGEFQGKETTIVVQMFGKPKKSSPEDNLKAEKAVIFPTLVHDALEKPMITNPKDGEITNEAAFDIRGTAKEGNFIEIYDKDQSIGITSIKDQKFNFKSEEIYEEGGHVFYVQAVDREKEEAGTSDSIKVIVDTIAPYVVKDSFGLSHLEVDKNKSRFNFSFKTYDNPTLAKIIYKDFEFEADKNEDSWYFSIENEKNQWEDISIVLYDRAGNSKKTTIKQEQIESIVSTGVSANLNYSFNKRFIEDVITRIMTKSLRGIVNFAIAFLMLILLFVQRFVLVESGLTKEESRPLLHLPVFAVLIFVALLGSGGEIL